MSIEIADFKSY